MRHETKWTWVSGSGGVLRFSTREGAVSHAQLLEALKSANLFLHHCWCDVQMNEYSYEKLQQEMAAVDAAIQKEQP